jgi:hypothetical protein
VDEEWRVCVEDCRYEVSSLGRVRRRVPGNGTHVGRILKVHANKWGYLQANLPSHGKTKAYSVHVLVMSAFVGPRPDGMQVNHKDNVRTNNALFNLEYVTPKQNTQYSFACGGRGLREYRGMANGMAKIDWQKASEIRSKYAAGGESYATLGKEYGLDQSTIGSLIRGETWIEGGRLVPEP